MSVHPGLKMPSQSDAGCLHPVSNNASEPLQMQLRANGPGVGFAYRIRRLEVGRGGGDRCNGDDSDERSGYPG